MAGTFDERIQILIDDCEGGGEVVGKVEYNQVYAHRQHVEVTWKHPRGGQAMYLSDPLFNNASTYVALIASECITPDGADPVKGMIEAVNALSLDSSLLAPLMWGNLKMSAHCWVMDNGATVYDHPSLMPRLTDDELDELHEIWSDLHPYPWPPDYFQRYNKHLQKVHGINA